MRCSICGKPATRMRAVEESNETHHHVIEWEFRCEEHK